MGGWIGGVEEVFGPDLFGLDGNEMKWEFGSERRE